VLSYTVFKSYLTSEILKEGCSGTVLMRIYYQSLGKPIFRRFGRGGKEELGKLRSSYWDERKITRNKLFKKGMIRCIALINVSGIRNKMEHDN
jgi:hypothetical protein